MAKSELIIEWDDEKQSVGLKFDTDEFRSWDFVMGVLEMSKLAAETLRHRGATEMQSQQQSVQADVEKILRQVKLP